MGVVSIHRNIAPTSHRGATFFSRSSLFVAFPQGLIDGSGLSANKQLGRPLWLQARCTRWNCHMMSNALLAGLTDRDFELLRPHLRPEVLPVRRQLQPRNTRVSRVYFLESGIASVVANGSHSVEIGLIGREGMTGLAVVLDCDKAKACTARCCATRTSS
jgi:hypothetical protein